MLKIGIVGFEPRELSVLERFVSKKLGQIIHNKLAYYIFDLNSLSN